MRITVWVVATAALATACSKSEPVDETPSAPPPAELRVELASYEVVAGEETRVAVGLLTPDNRVVSWGTVQVRFSALGRDTNIGPFDAEFLPVPGEEHGGSSPQPGPVVEAPTTDHPTGAYVATGIEFDASGQWILKVTADVNGIGPVTATGSIDVLEDALVPAPGEKAPVTENHLLGAKGVPIEAIDSRATTNGGRVPDPILHRTSIAEAIRSRRPALAIFSTPTYCVSRFCGPVTDVVEELAREGAGDTAFIHVEVWRDRQENVVNQAAADWILRNEGLTEPWLFLIGRDGVIQDRWDNLFSIDDVKAALAEASR